MASAEEAKTWTAANGGRIVFTSTSVPLRALSVQPETVAPAAQQKLAAGLQKGNTLKLAFSTATKADFKSVASVLNTTPTSLPGAKVISAAEARALVAKGVPVYDVRVADEYETAHSPARSPCRTRRAAPRKSGSIRPRPVRAEQAAQGQERAAHDVLRRHHLLEELQIRHHGDPGGVEERVLVPRRVSGVEGGGAADHCQEGIGNTAPCKSPAMPGFFWPGRLVLGHSGQWRS